MVLRLNGKKNLEKKEEKTRRQCLYVKNRVIDYVTRQDIHKVLLTNITP